MSPFLLALFSLTLAAPAETGALPPPREAFGRPRRKLLTADEIAQRIQAGGARYVEHPLSALTDVPEARIAETLWPKREEQLAFPTVLSGAVAVSSMAVDARAMEKIQQAEAPLAEGKYDAATALYREALTLCPRCYVALLQLGEVSRLTHRLPDALRYYEDALRLNPLDYRPLYYKGLALLEGEQPKAALEAWTAALALHPRNAVLLELLRRQAQRLRIVVVGDTVLPRAFARRKGEVVELYADTERGRYWLAYARCKALWLGDAEHRKEMTGSERHRFSSAEELECLTALTESYAAASKADDVFRDDPNVERIARILSEKRGQELILFELAARISPHATLPLARGDRAAIERFISRFVLPHD